MKKFVGAVFTLVFFLFPLFIFPQENSARVCLKGRCFNVEIADTPDERVRGLMYRRYLPSTKGMFFVFEKEGIYPFWMKNTYIPLDIIWIDSQMRVVDIKKNVLPCSSEKCPTFIPQAKAKYVLEINANVSEKIGLNIGDKLDFIVGEYKK